MTWNLQLNSTVPNIWPINHPEIILPSSNMATALTTKWKVNPFHGNFNPATNSGQKSFCKKTEGLADDKRLELTRADGSKFHQLMRSCEASLGNVIWKIPVENKADGTPTVTRNLITQHSLVSLENVVRTAQKCFNTEMVYPTAIPSGPYNACNIDPKSTATNFPTFYSSVDSSVVSKLIENLLNASGWSNLVVSKDQ